MPGSAPAGAGAEVISDYRDFDFSAIWAGREQVTAFERSLLARLLAGADLRRVVEIGTGFGRLSEGLAAAAGQYVGVDYDPRMLTRAAERARAARKDHDDARFALMNAYHPAFVPGAFTAAVMVRLYHHLSNPAPVLRRWARTLHRQGQLIVSYNPRPSLGTLVIDVKSRLRPTGGVPPPSITWSRTPIVEVPEGGMHTYSAPRREFDRAVEVSGLVPVRQVGAGLEEYLTRAPTGLLLRLSLGWPQGRGFPSRFAVLETPDGDETVLPPLDEIWACPRCGVALGLTVNPGEVAPRCGTCGWVGGFAPGVIDLRYSPSPNHASAPGPRGT